MRTCAVQPALQGSRGLVGLCACFSVSHTGTPAPAPPPPGRALAQHPAGPGVAFKRAAKDMAGGALVDAAAGCLYLPVGKRPFSVLVVLDYGGPEGKVSAGRRGPGARLSSRHVAAAVGSEPHLGAHAA